MKYLKQLFKSPVLCLGLVCSGLPGAATADAWNRKTEVVFSRPVEIPGVHLAGWGVLPAGTYVFKVMDSQANRHIVQIFSQDEKTIYATILAVPNERLQATGQTVITFRERAAGQPEALRAWFYPGRTSGEEFVYPKTQAMTLAKAANTPVLFTPAEMPVEVAEAAKLVEDRVIADLQRAPVKALQPTGEEVELAQVVTLPAPQAAQDASRSQLAQASATTSEAAPAAVPASAPVPAPAPTPTVESQPAPAAPAPMLPETDSRLPSIAMIGFLVVGSALALRSVRKHIYR